MWAFVQMFRSSGVHMFGCSDLRAFRCSDLRASRRSGAQTFGRSDVQVLRPSGVQTFRYSDLRAFRRSGVQILAGAERALRPADDTWCVIDWRWSRVTCSTITNQRAGQHSLKHPTQLQRCLWGRPHSPLCVCVCVCVRAAVLTSHVARTVLTDRRNKEQNVLNCNAMWHRNLRICGLRDTCVRACVCCHWFWNCVYKLSATSERLALLWTFTGTHKHLAHVHWTTVGRVPHLLIVRGVHVVSSVAPLSFGTETVTGQLFPS
jgi:hypothetical protein